MRRARERSTKQTCRRAKMSIGEAERGQRPQTTASALCQWICARAGECSKYGNLDWHRIARPCTTAHTHTTSLPSMAPSAQSTARKGELRYGPGALLQQRNLHRAEHQLSVLACSSGNNIPAISYVNNSLLHCISACMRRLRHFYAPICPRAIITKLGKRHSRNVDICIFVT